MVTLQYVQHIFHYEMFSADRNAFWMEVAEKETKNSITNDIAGCSTCCLFYAAILLLQIGSWNWA